MYFFIPNQRESNICLAPAPAGALRGLLITVLTSEFEVIESETFAPIPPSERITSALGRPRQPCNDDSEEALDNLPTSTCGVEQTPKYQNLDKRALAVYKKYKKILIIKGNDMTKRRATEADSRKSQRMEEQSPPPEILKQKNPLSRLYAALPGKFTELLSPTGASSLNTACKEHLQQYPKIVPSLKKSISEVTDNINDGNIDNHGNIDQAIEYACSSKLFFANDLEKLAITHCAVLKINNLIQALPTMNALKTLELPFELGDDIRLAELLKKCPNLQELVISGGTNGINSILGQDPERQDPEIVRILKNIKILKVLGTELEDRDIASLITQCPSLQQLNIKNNNSLNNGTIEAIASTMRNLVEFTSDQDLWEIPTIDRGRDIVIARNKLLRQIIKNNTLLKTINLTGDYTFDPPLPISITAESLNNICRMDKRQTPLKITYNTQILNQPNQPNQPIKRRTISYGTKDDLKVRPINKDFTSKLDERHLRRRSI